MRISDWSSDVCSSDLAVTAAYAGLGLWALVIQRIVTEIISTLLSRASYRWTPGWAFRWPTLKRNLSINGSLTATQLVFIFTTRLQELVIGSVIGVVAVGIYRTAWRTVDMIPNGAIRPFATEIGRATCRERVCMYVTITVDYVS